MEGKSIRSSNMEWGLSTRIYYCTVPGTGTCDFVAISPLFISFV